MLWYAVFAVSLAIVAGYTQEDVERLERRVEEVEALLESYEMRLNEQAQTVKVQRNTLLSLMEAQEQLKMGLVPIGFAAHSVRQHTYQNDDQFSFEAVITNRGYVYDRDESTFYCPYDGLYMFSATVYVELDNHIATDIMRNNETLVQVTAADTLQSDQATNIVVGQFDAGDEIWVKAAENGIVEGFPTPMAVTSFTGALIQIM